ncbi:uncharacterized protein LOC113466905 [Diaphorina citri]|uniref:Uncharacterized protein LOC113466905 n=1 Tax=Diaphorina citri TaxID=121845 RepID=A0A3Q0IUZ8_DIACI|nr:uncharacterized protein LOC113466905 [Diaphorina citri]
MCFKIDLMKIIDRLNSTDQFTVLPGVHIVRTIDPSTSPLDLPSSLILSILRNSSTDTSQLDEALLIKLRSYLSQLSVHVKLLDTAFLMESNETALSTESTGRTFFTSWKDTLTNFMGRGKKQNYGHAAIWSAGTLAALGFAMLAALSGKALVTSILALGLAAICAFKGHGHGHGGYGNYGYGKTSHYEIITKPAHYHDHEHLHSTSLAAAASPYASYARQLVPSLFEETQLSEATDPYSYVPHEERSL